MSDKSNKYGYVGVDIPAQSFGANKGVFNPAEINDLVADNKWTSFGQLELISTQTASGISAVEFTTSSGTLDLSYDVHFLTYNNLSVSSNAEPIRCQLYENGVLETASVYQFAYQYCYNTGTFLEAKTTATSGIYITNDMGNGSTDSTNGYRYFYNLGDSSKYSFVTGNGISNLYTPTGTYIMGFGSNVLPQASVVDGIKIFVYVGTFSGTISLYGIRYS